MTSNESAHQSASPCNKWIVIGECLAGVALFVTVISLFRNSVAIPKTLKHGVTMLAALLAVVGSILQARRASARSRDSGENELKTNNSEIKQIHHYDSLHFKHVSTLWWIVFAGAAASL